MRNFIYPCILAFLIFSACNNSDKSSNGASDTTKVTNSEITNSFYKRLAGTISGKPVVMHLQKVGNDFSGVYYYDGSWINLSTDTIISKDSLVLFENGFYDYYFDKNAGQSRISLKWTGNGFNGSLKNDKETKSFRVILKESYPVGSYKFTTGIYQDSVKANEKNEKSPIAKISFEYVKPTINDETESWLNNQLKRISGLRSINQDREIGFKKIAEAYFDAYKSEITEQQKEGPDRGFSQWMNYTNDSQQSIAYNDNGYVVIDFLADAYTGGAHGNYSSVMYCLDVQNKNQMILSDIIKIDSNSLQKILEKNFRKNYNIKPNEEISSVLFDNFIKPSNNFYFNNYGLAFMYNPYEVASYAQGQIVVFIPFVDLKGYLKPSFMKRMKIK